jgi:hypothetical protein
MWYIAGKETPLMMVESSIGFGHRSTYLVSTTVFFGKLSKNESSADYTEGSFHVAYLQEKVLFLFRPITCPLLLKHTHKL